MIHELKISPKFFEDVANESKTFEVRKMDRPFHVWDYLALNEFDGQYWTGRCLLVKITYILKDKEYCKPGYCILGIAGCAIRSKNDLCEPILHLTGIPIYGDKECETNE